MCVVTVFCKASVLGLLSDNMAISVGTCITQSLIDSMIVKSARSGTYFGRSVGDIKKSAKALGRREIF